MGAFIDATADRRLLDATLAYVASHTDSRFDAFREAVAHWGEDWTGVAPVHLIASDLLAKALPLARSGSAERKLMSLYVQERSSRCWEQSYTAADAAVGADMLAGYGYTEIVGKRGPFLRRTNSRRRGDSCAGSRLSRASPSGRRDLRGPRGFREVSPRRASAGEACGGRRGPHHLAARARDHDGRRTTGAPVPLAGRRPPGEVQLCLSRLAITAGSRTMAGRFRALGFSPPGTWVSADAGVLIGLYE